MTRRIFHIRQGETGRALLAFVILMLVVGAFTIVKAVRDAVFLTRFSVAQLSLIAIGIAAVMGFVVAAYTRLTARVDRVRLVVGSYVVVAASLLPFWWGLGPAGGGGWLAWVLYVWSSLFGVFIVMQFWLLAGSLFDVREARRTFGLVGAGAVVGGLVGGLLSRLAGVVGTPSLLLIAAGMLALASGVVGLAARWAREEAAQKSRDEAGVAAGERLGSGLLGFVSRHRYVRLLALLLLIATVAATLIDWQLKAVARHAYAGRPDAMAAFFGGIYAALSAGSLLLQATVTGWVLRRSGVGGGLSVLPMALVLAAAAVVASPLLPMTLLALVSGAKVVESGLRFTIDKASVELIWLPLSRRVRERGKALVDTVGDRIGTGLTGVLWLVLAAVGLDRPENLHWIALLVVVLALSWLVLLRRVRGAYVELFRQALARRRLDLSDLRRSLGEAGARRTLDDALRSGDPGQVRFALYALSDAAEALPDLASALRHDDPAVRVEALTLLTERADTSQRAAAEPSLRHPDPAVREAAVIYLRETAPAGRDPVLDGQEPRESSDAFVYSLARLSGETEAVERAPDLAASIAAAEGEALLERIALLGGAPPDTAAELLGPLLEHDDASVIEAALKAAGRSRAKALVPRLVDLLGQRRWRARAFAALADIGAGAVGRLAERMLDPGTPAAVRRSLIRLAGASHDPSAVSALTRLLDDPRADLARQAIRSLARLRSHRPLPIETGPVLARLGREIAALHRALRFLDHGPWPSAHLPREDEPLLHRAVREATDRRVEQIVRLLSLVYEPTDIQAAHRGLRSPSRASRAKSIEFLDNLLAPDLKRTLLPALEDGPRRAFVTASRHAVGELGTDDYVEHLLDEGDGWLLLVAIWTAGYERRDDLRDRLDQRRAAADIETRAVLDRALARIDRKDDSDGRPAEEDSMALTVIEKVLKLQGVDVLKRASSEDLAYVAQITQELAVEPDVAIYRQGDAPDALYVVVSGRVRLHQDRDEIAVLEAGETFGSWALFDEAPRLATATAAEPTVVLKVEREEFLELLADRVDIVQAVFRAMVERIRSLAVLAQGS